MAIQVSNTVTISRPLKDVQRYVGDLTNEPKYWAGVKSIKLLEGTPGAVGAKYERVFEAMGKDQTTTITVAEVVPDQKTVVVSGPGMVTVRGTMTFEAVPEGTKLNLQLDAQTKGLMAMLLKSKIRKSIEQNTATSLTNLKNVLESERPAPAAAPARSNGAKTAKASAKTTSKK